SQRYWFDRLHGLQVIDVDVIRVAKTRYHHRLFRRHNRHRRHFVAVTGKVDEAFEGAVFRAVDRDPLLGIVVAGVVAFDRRINLSLVHIAIADVTRTLRHAVEWSFVVP